jgi:hypothetical protein
MADASVVLTPISFANHNDTQRTPVVDGPAAAPDQPEDGSLDSRIYRTLARTYIQEERKRAVKTKRATSLYVTLISAAFFMALMAIVYLGVR